MNKANQEIRDNLKQVIDALLECEREGRSCKRCKHKNECLIFVRDSVATALQLLLTNMIMLDTAADIYT